MERLNKDVESLNQMLRDAGYGQGQIDSYVAQCEEMEQLRKEYNSLIAWLEHIKTIDIYKVIQLRADLRDPDKCTQDLVEQGADALEQLVCLICLLDKDRFEYISKESMQDTLTWANVAREKAEIILKQYPVIYDKIAKRYISVQAHQTILKG